MSREVTPGTPPERAWLRMLLVVAQLALILAVFRVYELENRTVFQILSLALAGFLVHAHLPSRFQLPFFAALSVGSVPLVLGPAEGVLVISVGVILIGVGHLRIPLPARLILLVLLGVGLFVIRGKAHSILPPAAGTVLGAMFMFRLAVYFQTIRHRDAEHGAAEALAYHFMLPNVVFPLYPVVDYKTFLRTRFDAERFAIYDRGIRYMLLGVAHLLGYRLVAWEWALDERYVNNLGQVVQYVVTTFALYLKVSGQFHFIVGLLGLYGFRLPKTNHLYFLSSSPADFWRRINIYWKDFMMKLVYYPSFFRFRSLGRRPAMALATVVVFLLTWLLHWYQRWWIAGYANLFSRRDLAFWGILGVLVIVMMLWETRPTRQVSRTSRRWSVTRGAGTVATMLLICFLWSLWNLQSMESWLFMWSQVRYSTPQQWGVLLLLLAGALVVSGFNWGAPTLAEPPSGQEPLALVLRRALGRGAVVGVALVAAIPAVRSALPVRLAESVHHMEGRGDPQVWAAKVQLGYYEELTTPESSRLTTPWRPPAPFGTIRLGSLYRERADFLVDELTPLRDTLWDGLPVRTNAWGMRDKEYALAKPPGTFRIALMGPSYVYGAGVADGETFGAVLETELDSLARLAGREVEVLNFGVPANSLAQSVYRIERQALAFSPDLIILAVSPYDLVLLQFHVRRLAERGISVPDSALAQLLAEAGFGRGGGQPELRPFEERIDLRLFNWAQEMSAPIGARVVVAAFSQPGQPGQGNLATIFRAVRGAGLPLLDCTKVFDGMRPELLRVSETDAHPNAQGQRLLAHCLFQDLGRQPSEFGLDWLPWPPPKA